MLTCEEHRLAMDNVNISLLFARMWHTVKQPASNIIIT